MKYDVCETRWFQILERCWRPAQSWGFAIVAVAYGVRPVIGLDFSEGTFAALGAAAGVGFLARTIEKVKAA